MELFAKSCAVGRKLFITLLLEPKFNYLASTFKHISNNYVQDSYLKYVKAVLWVKLKGARCSEPVKSSVPSSPQAKVRCQGQVRAARAQLCMCYCTCTFWFCHFMLCHGFENTCILAQPFELGKFIIFLLVLFTLFIITVLFYLYHCRVIWRTM